MMFAVLGVAVPLMRPVFPSRALAEMIARRGCRNPIVAAAGYHEPSLVFLAGTRTRLVDGCERRRNPARRRLPLRDHRDAPGPRFRAARRARSACAISLRGAARQQLQHQWRTHVQLRHLPLGAAAVSVEPRPRRACRTPALRRIARQPRRRGSRWSARPRRFKASRLLPPRRRLALGALAGIVLVGVAMHVPRRARRDVRRARCRPGWSTPSTRSPTSASPAGSWFRSPCLIVLAAILATPAAGRDHQSRAREPGRALRLLFLAIALPGLVRHHREAADRPAAALRARAVRLCPVVVAARIRQPAVGALRRRPSRPRSRSARYGRRRACRCWIYAGVIAVEPRRHHGAFRQRCGRGGLCRRLRRDSGAQLVRGARLAFRARRRRRGARRCRARPGAASRRLPARLLGR